MNIKRKPDEFQDFIILQVIVFIVLISVAMSVLYWISRIALIVLFN